MVAIFNDALLVGVFSESWSQTRMCLLPKKGDLTLLTNYYLIPLINTNTKVFTRLVNARIIPCVCPVISPIQTGFSAGKFIADNSFATPLIMEYACYFRLPGIGLLLNQEKTYDCVYPTYLCLILLHIGFPLPLVLSLCNLFFSTIISILVKGYISGPVYQNRGLCQGDPLSLVLFDLAFDPLI